MTNPNSGLTDAAKAEIAEAIRIVRADRFEKHVRDTLGKHSPAPTPPAPTPPTPTPTPPAPTPPAPGGPTPPPVKEPPADPPADPPKRGLWWGDRLHSQDQ